MKSSVFPLSLIGCLVAGCTLFPNPTGVHGPCHPQTDVLNSSGNPRLSVPGFPPLEDSGFVPIPSDENYLPYSWLAICVGQNRIDRPELLHTDKTRREDRFLDIWHLRDSFNAEPYLSLFFHGSTIEELRQEDGLQISNVVYSCFREEFIPACFHDSNWSMTISGDKAFVELHGEKVEKSVRCTVRLKRVWPMQNRFLWKLENVEDEDEKESLEWFGWRKSGNLARFPSVESTVSEGVARIRSIEVRSRFRPRFACRENTSAASGENINPGGENRCVLVGLSDSGLLNRLLFLGHDALFEGLLDDGRLSEFGLNQMDTQALSVFRALWLIPWLQDERRFSESVVRALYGVPSQELPDGDDDQLDMLVRHCIKLGYCGEPEGNSVSWKIINKCEDNCLVELQSHGETTDRIFLKKRWLSRNRSVWLVASFSGPLVIF